MKTIRSCPLCKVLAGKLKWKLWHRQVFHHLLPYNKWATAERNLAVGDVCAIKYEDKVRPGKADYRLCQVDRVETDDKGLVRTVYIKMRRRDTRTKGLPYSGPDLVEMKTAVQRLVVICPADSVPVLTAS